MQARKQESKKAKSTEHIPDSYYAHTRRRHCLSRIASDTLAAAALQTVYIPRSVSS